MLKLCILTIRILSKLPSKSTKWHFRDSKFKNFLGLSALATPLSKRTFYRTARFCNMSVRKICVFLFVNCVFFFRIANTFVASYAMKYSEISFVIREFLPYSPPPPQLCMLSYVPGDNIQSFGSWKVKPCMSNARVSSGVSYPRQIVHQFQSLYTPSSCGPSPRHIVCQFQSPYTPSPRGLLQISVHKQ